MKSQKRVMAINDISCFGRCSLTVVLPIISSAGIETTVLPTAVLSTHTGGFENYTYTDFTDEILPITEHWKSLGLEFDAIYSGYLGSFKQLDIVEEVIARMKTDKSIIIIDPVMGDNGKLYSNFVDEFPKGMAGLCKKADIIIPNMTEATLLLGEEYIEPPYSKEYIEGLLKKLSNLGPSKIVLTGVQFDNENLGVACFENNTIKYYFQEKINGYYHGTGDVFASAFVSVLMNNFSLYESAQIAVHFTVNSIKRTVELGTDIRFGVDFEEEIPNFIKALNLYKN